MKTQVIQLDSHDDVTSVRDRMSWAKTERILLVFPRRSRILTRTLDLRLLQRHAATLGAQLAIVARSEELRRVAKASNIPAFTKVGPCPARDLGNGEKPRPGRNACTHVPTCTRCASRHSLTKLTGDPFMAFVSRFFPWLFWRSSPFFRYSFRPQRSI